MAAKTTDAALPAFPVVLIHGFADNPEILPFWKATEQDLALKKVDALVVKMPPYGSIEERSNSLVQQIRAKYEGKTVHLIAHSMGGLNAREIATRSPEDRGFGISTITTFGTPHGGVKPLDLIFNPGVSILSDKVHDLIVNTIGKVLSSDMGALKDMSTAATEKLTEKTKSSMHANNNIKYFSWAGQVSIVTPHLLSVLQGVVFPYGPNDGLISVESATWGTFLGTLQGVDHITMMGPKNVLPTLSRLAAAEKGEDMEVKPVKNDLFTALGRGSDSRETIVRVLLG